jgi:hypothetical protein
MIFFIYTAKRGRVQNLQIIGVHIRRGDYLLPGKIKYGYNIVTKKYIRSGSISMTVDMLFVLYFSFY